MNSRNLLRKNGTISIGHKRKLKELLFGVAMNTLLETGTNIKESTGSKNAQNNIFLERYSRIWMSFWLGFSDAICLFAAGLLAVGLRMLMGNLVDPPFYWSLMPLVIVFLAIYFWKGLYPGVGMSSVEELRRLTVSTSMVFLLVTAVAFWVRSAEYYSRLIFAFAWILSLIMLPLGRAIIRALAVQCGVWGEPVAVVGFGAQGKQVVEFLLRNLRFGLKPIAVLDEFVSADDPSAPVPIFRLEYGKESARPINFPEVKTIVLITSEMPESLQNAIVDQQRFGFRRLILIPNLHWVGSVGIVPYDLEGFLGLEVRQNLLNTWEQALKRILDLLLVFTLGIFLIPLLGLIILLIRIDSRGSALFRQERIGKNGRKFSIWKFRTMFEDADRILSAYFEKNTTARNEWVSIQKLKRDPRVTRIGQLLRLTSLDELPQLWNVLKGEMSMVGPRPIVAEEIGMYKGGFNLYRQVRPGITGLWQVSGRNDVGYEIRVRLDEYYVRNWSFWLDIYVLIKTVWSVLKREGAY